MPIKSTSLYIFYRNSDDDTDEDGEMTDHDLTPCNASPSLSQLLQWGGMGGAAAGKFGDHDEIEEVWKNHVHILTQNTSNEVLLETFSVFAKLFEVVRKFEIDIAQPLIVMA
jgi:hypothetical protein